MMTSGHPIAIQMWVEKGTKIQISSSWGATVVWYV